MNLRRGVFWIATIAFATACEPTEQAKKDIETAFTPDLPAEPSPPPAPPVQPYCYNKRTTQPEAQVTKKVDILFVPDTSGSLAEERTGIADGIDGFIQSLPADVDFQISVALAHGSLSSWVGKLYRYGNSPFVLKSSELSIAQIRGFLRDTMLRVAGDNASDGGEQGMYALQRLLAPANLAAAQAQGFFRSDAALAVVFVADENDICASFPEGYKPVPDPDGAEVKSFARDCAGITPESTLQKLKALQGQRPLVVSGIVYTDKVNYPKYGENEYGWGYMETVALSQGVSVNLANADYYNGLKQIGALTSIKLNLITEITLSGNIDPLSVKVKVDGMEKPFNFIESTKTVHLVEPGGAKSTVDVSWCLGADNL